MLVSGAQTWHAAGLGPRRGWAVRLARPSPRLLRAWRPSRGLGQAGKPPAVRSQYATGRQPAAAPRYAPAPAPSSPPVLAPRRPPSPDDIIIARSNVADKEVITRTSGVRLGYINQLYVDPARLQVVGVYLRDTQFAVPGVTYDEDHFGLRNMLQVGDVVLVHDEKVLLDPPFNESYGCYRLVGATVKTETGKVLGKVRDFLFNPDTGEVSTIKYDKFGKPLLPQQLFTTHSLGWQEIRQVGPEEVIVARGAEERQLKENDGLVSVATQALNNLLGSLEEEPAGGGGTGGGGMYDDAYLSSPEYRAWYEQFGVEFQRASGKAMPAPLPARGAGSRKAAQQAPVPVRRAPPALPPASTPAYGQVFQPAQQAQQAGQPWQQVVQPAQQPAREAVPAGWGNGAPPMQQRAGQAWQQPMPQAWPQSQGLADVQFPAQPPQQQPPPQQPGARMPPAPAAAPRAAALAGAYAQPPGGPPPGQQPQAQWPGPAPMQQPQQQWAAGPPPPAQQQWAAGPPPAQQQWAPGPPAGAGRGGAPPAAAQQPLQQQPPAQQRPAGSGAPGPVQPDAVLTGGYQRPPAGAASRVQAEYAPAQAGGVQGAQAPAAPRPAAAAPAPAQPPAAQPTQQL